LSWIWYTQKGLVLIWSHKASNPPKTRRPHHSWQNLPVLDSKVQLFPSQRPGRLTNLDPGFLGFGEKCWIGSLPWKLDFSVFGNWENLESRRRNSFSCSKKWSGFGGEEEKGVRILGSFYFLLHLFENARIWICDRWVQVTVKLKVRTKNKIKNKKSVIR
jgi:hypothetical protein